MKCGKNTGYNDTTLVGTWNAIGSELTCLLYEEGRISAYAVFELNWVSIPNGFRALISNNKSALNYDSYGWCTAPHEATDNMQSHRSPFKW